MGNEQSGEQGHPVLETGLRLSTLCRYQAETGSGEGLTPFNWFNPSIDISGLVLKGAHRWGYVLSRAGGQRLFKDMRQRFFVLLDHYLCYFDTHAPEARMRGSIDLDKTLCLLKLLPRPPDRVVVADDGMTSVVVEDVVDVEERHHRVEVIRKSDGWSMIMCFRTANELQSWMKSIFDVQQRKSTFSPLLHGNSDTSSSTTDDDGIGGGGGCGILLPRRRREASMDDSISQGSNNLRSSSSTRSGRNSNSSSSVVGAPRSRSISGRRVFRNGNSNTNSNRNRSSNLALSADLGGRGEHGNDNDWVHIGTHGGGGGDSQQGGSRRGGRRRPGGGDGGSGRRQQQHRSTLYSPPQRLSSSSDSGDGGCVPLSWADSKQSCEDRSSKMSARLAKASEKLAALPRGGRAPDCREGINSSLDEYGAFTTAHASIYEGWTRGLQAHGWGRMIYVQGDYVEGWWEHDVLEGTGQHTSQEEGWTYRGEFVAGERHGPGRLETAEGDVWECEWRRGGVAEKLSGTHHKAGNGTRSCMNSSASFTAAALAGFEEVYQGGCGPSYGDRKAPCRVGHGKLKWRDGEQVETLFKDGRAVDGTKGVVRFRNGAIFFGQLRDAQPHGYGELYLSSVKPDGRNSASSNGSNRSLSSSSSSSSLPAGAPATAAARMTHSNVADLDETARDILWYKGPFRRGKPHGTGLVKYKDPSPPPPQPQPSDPLASVTAVVGRSRCLLDSTSVSGGRSPSLSRDTPSIPSMISPVMRPPGHSRPPGRGRGESGVSAVSSSSGSPPVPTAESVAAAAAAAVVRRLPPAGSIWGESKEEEEETVERETGIAGNGRVGRLGGEEEEEDGSDEDEDEDEEEEGDSDSEEEDDELEGGEQRRHATGGPLDGGEEKATAGTSRQTQRLPDSYGGGGGAGSGWRGADMEYEAEFIDGVMIRHDPSHLRLAALRFGRAEIRCLETMLRREEEAMARLHSRNLCLLCNTEEMNALLMDCRHRVLCMGCAARADTCPVCRETIGKVVKTYTT